MGVSSSGASFAQNFCPNCDLGALSLTNLGAADRLRTLKNWVPREIQSRWHDVLSKQSETRGTRCPRGDGFVVEVA